MKKIVLYLFLLILVGSGLFYGMNHWQNKVLSKNLAKIENNDHLILFLEKVMPKEATNKIKIQRAKGNEVLVATFKMKEGQNPKRIIGEFIKWSSKAINQQNLDVDSIRIFVYFDKNKEQFYTVVGKNKLDNIDNFNFENFFNDCEKTKPLDIRNFCIKSINL